MNNEHLKIYNAKMLLLRQDELNGKTHKFPNLAEDFNLSKEAIISLLKDGLISFNLCCLEQAYITKYNRERKDFEISQIKKTIGQGGLDAEFRKSVGWDTHLADKHCGLSEKIYSKLMKDGFAEVNILDYENTIKSDLTPMDFISFYLKIDIQKMGQYLNEKIASFINDELDLSPSKEKQFSMHNDVFDAVLKNAHRFLSYERQKEQFAIAINNQIILGFPRNNLKIDYTQIWNKDTAKQTNFLETALGMEREGFIEIKDIIEQMPENLMIITSDLFWKYPTVIQIKILPDFYKYYEGVYAKYNPTQDNQNAPKSSDKKEAKKLKYQHYSAESLKKIIGVLNHLKDEWDLTPKETSSQNSGAYTYHKEANQASIPQRRYLSWLNDCGLGDYYQLESILTILQQEGLISEFKTLSEYM